MNNSIKDEDRKKEAAQIQENYEDKYWSEQYGVSSEELKKTGTKIGLSAKIIRAVFKKKSYSL